MRHTILFIGEGDEVGMLLHNILRICHGYAKTCIQNHADVIESIATGNEFGTVNTNFIKKV